MRVFTLLLLIAAPALAQDDWRDFSSHFGPRSAIEERLGGLLVNPLLPPLFISFVAPDIYQVGLPTTGTAWAESFVLGLPPNPLPSAPVLVLFHGFGESPRQLVTRTTYFQEAMARGWVVVAPLSANRFHYSIGYAQQNTQVALDWVATNVSPIVPLDPDRIYGVGFSMGGGMAASYAARHLDPGHARFAAIVDHTGTNSLRYTYQDPSAAAFMNLPELYGGPPSSDPFSYARYSAMDMDPARNVSQLNDMARNLVLMPLRTRRAAGDPVPFLPEQSCELDMQYVLRGGTSDFAVLPMAPAPPFHTWSTLDETTTLDFLAPITRADPPIDTFVRVLADRAGTWHFLDIEQPNAPGFSPLRFKVIDGTANLLAIDEIRNIDRIAFDANEAGLQPLNDLHLILGSTSAAPIDIAVSGYAQIPIDVRRGAVPVAFGWDPATGTITFTEPDPTNFPNWTIQP